LYEAEIVAEGEMRMPDVSKVKVALAAPAGMNTLEGTRPWRRCWKAQLGRHLRVLVRLR
jgi:hypothetical protein